MSDFSTLEAACEAVARFAEGRDVVPGFGQCRFAPDPGTVSGDIQAARIAERTRLLAAAIRAGLRELLCRVEACEAVVDALGEPDAPEPPTPRSAAPVDPYVEQVESSRPLASRALDTPVLTEEERRLVESYRACHPIWRPALLRAALAVAADTPVECFPGHEDRLAELTLCEAFRKLNPSVRRRVLIGIESGGDMFPPGPYRRHPVPDVHVAVSPEAIDSVCSAQGEVA